MLFQKEDLEGTEYYWIEKEIAMYNGQPSRRSFDKFNGNQVLFLINFYSTLSETFTVTEGRSIEKRIKNDLPEDIKSEIAVFNWIKNPVAAE
jgi:hypothetical protein